MTKFKFGIIGYPLGHTLSPIMHAKALGTLGLEGSYKIFETEPNKVAEQIEFFKQNSFSGINVTIPHKVEVMKFVDSLDKTATLVGAVNTIKFNNDGSLIGYNTDVTGFIGAIPENFKITEASLIGSGGAARAILAGLCMLGTKKINVYTIDHDEAEKLVNVALSHFDNVEFTIQHLNKDLDLTNQNILVHATPLGMKGKFEGVSPVTLETLKTLPDDAIVYDIVYNPLKTELINQAKTLGLKTISGVEMFVLQGAKAFEIWTGQNPPVDVMRQVILDNFAPKT